MTEGCTASLTHHTAISAVAAAMCQAFSPIPDGAGKARHRTNATSPTTRPIAWRRAY